MRVSRLFSILLQIFLAGFDKREQSALVKTEIYLGRDAQHTITFVDTALETSPGEAGLKEWRAETGAARLNQGFASAGNASKWVKTMLGKAGWPYATEWQIRPATVIPAPWEKDQSSRTVFRAYMVKEKAPAPTAQDKLRAIVALCENPHFTTDRKYRIAELAAEALRLLGK